MDKQTMLARYATYFDPIRKLASFKSYEPAGVEKVFQSKSLMQKAYNDVREIGFDGRVTDYLAWISTAFMVDRVRSRVSKKMSTLEWSKVICEQYETDKEDVTNFLRLWGFYDYAFSLLDAEVEQRDFKGGEVPEYTEERFEDYVKASAFLAAFQEMTLFDEYFGRKCENIIEKAEAIAETLKKFKLP